MFDSRGKCLVPVDYSGNLQVVRRHPHNTHAHATPTRVKQGAKGNGISRACRKHFRPVVVAVVSLRNGFQEPTGPVQPSSEFKLHAEKENASPNLQGGGSDSSARRKQGKGKKV
jgi:hypothetical protein